MFSFTLWVNSFALGWNGGSGGEGNYKVVFLTL